MELVICGDLCHVSAGFSKQARGVLAQTLPNIPFRVRSLSSNFDELYKSYLIERLDLQLREKFLFSCPTGDTYS